MTTFSAHVAGAPVEELLTAAPGALAFGGVVLAGLRARLRNARAALTSSKRQR